MALVIGRQLVPREAMYTCDNKKCKEFGVAPLKYMTDTTQMTGMLEYRHECPVCGKDKWLDRIFPADVNNPLWQIIEPRKKEEKKDTPKRVIKPRSRKKGSRRKRTKPKGK